METTRLRLSLPQSRVFAASYRKRFCVVVAGRRFGKTTLALARLYAGAIGKPDGDFWYVAPTYRQAKQIAWKVLKRLVLAPVRASVNETELSITIINGATITLKGADNYDSLRGTGLDGLVLDEFADMQPDAWEEVLRPALADREGWAMFIGTPRGFNHFYDFYQYARDPGNAPWQGWQFTTAEGGFVRDEELAELKATLSLRAYRQEMEASFEALGGRVYYAFDRKGNLNDSVEDLHGDLLVGMDFNVNPMSAVLGVRAGDELHILDELELPNSNTEEMAGAIAERWSRRPLTELERENIARFGHIEGTTGRTDAPRSLIVCPDPSGGARKTSAPVGETDFTILRRHGFRVDSPGHSWPIVDRINTVNALLQSADGRRRLRVHPRCKRLTKSFEGLTYKEGTNLPDKTSGLDHMADALGYLVMQHFPLQGNRLSQSEGLF